MTLPVVCPSCKKPVDALAKYCPECGRGIATMRVRVRSRGKSELLEQRISCEPDAVETIESVGKIEIDVPESPPDWDK